MCSRTCPAPRSSWSMDHRTTTPQIATELGARVCVSRVEGLPRALGCPQGLQTGGRGHGRRRRHLPCRGIPRARSPGPCRRRHRGHRPPRSTSSEDDAGAELGCERRVRVDRESSSRSTPRDLHSGQRAYRRSLIDEFDWDTNGPAFPVDLLLWPAKAGCRISEIDIPYRDRIGDTTLSRWPSGKMTMKRLLHPSRQIRPIR